MKQEHAKILQHVTTLEPCKWNDPCCQMFCLQVSAKKGCQIHLHHLETCFLHQKVGLLLIPIDFSVWFLFTLQDWLLSHCSIYVHWPASRESFARRWLLRFKLRNHSQQDRICNAELAKALPKEKIKALRNECTTALRLIPERPNGPYLLCICIYYQYVFLNVYSIQ